MSKDDNYISYVDEVKFMKSYIDIIELVNTSKKAKVAISPALQGRVMTSSANGENGRSYGWINRELFESKEPQEHIHVYGGEERFWLGPEGGQYSIFFKKDDAFTLDNWYTPRLIDLEPFDVVSSTSNRVMFTKKATLKNYSGFQFKMDIKREVAILSDKEIMSSLGLQSINGINIVAYKTTNILTNLSDLDWKKDTGLLSIWMLGMYNPSPSTTVIVPYVSGDDADLGIPVNDSYFGKVPKERLVVKEDVIYFSGDGKFRSKIGLSPKRAKSILGSYDTVNGILTIVKYNKPEHVFDYVNSMWEIQEQPYAGDVVNSYNDGAPEPGKAPLGPFYELETSSPALELKSGESGTHIQSTFHMEGDESQLNPVIKNLFSVTIDDIKNAFE